MLTSFEEESPVDSGDQSNDGIQGITVSEGDPAGKDSSIVESGEEDEFNNFEDLEQGFERQDSDSTQVWEREEEFFD